MKQCHQTFMVIYYFNKYLLSLSMGHALDSIIILVLVRELNRT